MVQVTTLSAAELTALVEGAITRALSEYEGAPTLLDRAGLAKALSCSPSHIDNLRKRGLPTVNVGDAPRFEIGAVLAWLKANGS